MKTISKTFLLLLAVVIISCSGGGGAGGSASDMATISIDLGDLGRSGAGISTMVVSEDIARIKIVITGADMDPVTLWKSVSGITGGVIELKVPIGPARRFQVFAYDSEENLIYTGETTTAITISTRIVTIQLITSGFCEFTEVAYERDRVLSPENNCSTSSGGLYNRVCSDDDYDDNLYYNLPWPFPFYGTEYNRISFDTNGNVWFGGNSYDDQFNLPTTDGQGPVIAAWNEYLSSYDYGEYRLQHRHDPDRVVIEWETETYDDYSSGSCGGPCLNLFYIILYPNGDIRLNYHEFNYDYEPDDYGSGISNGDGVNYLSLTDELGPVYELDPRTSLYYKSCLPYLTNMSPENGAGDQAFNSNVRIVINSPMGIDFETFSINLRSSGIAVEAGAQGSYDETYTDTDPNVFGSGTAAKYRVRVNPDLDFPSEDEIESIVNVDDVAGNSLIPPEWLFTIERDNGYYYPSSQH